MNNLSLPLNFRIRLFMILSSLFITATLSAAPTQTLSPESSTVTFATSKLTVPTYTFGNIETVAPIFQASDVKGLYPYTSFDRESLSSEPVPVEYESLTLENEYLRVILLPELGGRIWSAWDKIREKELFYNPGAIKPTSYNQRGAWPAGNLEVYGPYDAHMLTWPGEPWVWAAEKNADGSASVTLSHIEHFFRNKLSMKVTLYPGHNYLELSINLHNRTTLPNRYLLWTNAGLPTSDGTRFVYPMTKTIGHDSAEFGAWPVFNGVDLSWYKNNKVMLGVFGLDVYDNFMGAYDYDEDFGTLCYSDRNIAHGIKTWTWGVGQVGLRHVEQYSDSGIPYIEVQSGRFVWDGNYEFIHPGKTDGWTEYWFAASGLGGFTTATKDISLFLEPNPKQPESVSIRLSSTSNFPQAQLIWLTNGTLQGNVEIPLTTGQVVEKQIDLGQVSELADVRFQVVSKDEDLVDYTYYPNGQSPKPEVASDFIPREFGSSEQLTAEELFQKGLTNEKLGRLPEARIAYEEALARDPNMLGPNIQLGLLAWSRLETPEAISHFEKALEREPFNGEALYYLAVIYSETGNNQDARRLLYRLLPSSGKFEQRDYGIGLLAIREKDYSKAQPLLSSAARTRPTQLSIRQANAFVLRKTGSISEAISEGDQILEIDPTNAFARAEKALLRDWQEPEISALDRACSYHPQVYLELVTEYMNLRGWEEANQLLIHTERVIGDRIGQNPLLLYYRVHMLAKMGESSAARELVETLSKRDFRSDIFPFRRESVTVLKTALKLKPNDPNATSLLALLLYSKSHRDQAKQLWRTSLESNPQHFSSLQHLGWALVEEGQVQPALALLDRASQVRPEDSGTAIGIARLYSRLGRVDDGLKVVENTLQKNPESDRLIELQIRFKALKGETKDAYQILSSHRFGTRHQSYSLLHLYQAIQLLKAYDSVRSGVFEQAIQTLEDAQNPPGNLGTDDFATLVSSRLLLFKALTHSQAGDNRSSLSVWREAAHTIDQDLDGEGLFRAIGLFMTGEVEAAEKWFKEFESVNQQRKVDNDTSVKVLAYYLSGIYSIFRGQPDKGRQDLQTALHSDESNLFARHAILWLDSGLFQFD